MKKLYFIILALLPVGLTFAQTYQATIKPGSLPNSVIIAIKPSANTTNVKLLSLSLAVGVPATALPRPTLAIQNKFNVNMNYEIQVDETAEAVAGKGNYHVVNFLGDGPQTDGDARNFTAGVDNNILEVSFSGGPVTPSEVLLLNLPGGGSTGQSYFYISDKGADVTNVSTLFYGTGATNGAGGQESVSFVPIAGISLPVKFLSFYALKNGDDAKLNWTVENDEDNKLFEIERSLNGRQFAPVSMMNALGNGKSINTYEATDLALSGLGSRTVFYRIKQIDKNNTITYSEVRTLTIGTAGTAANLFPNPARTFTKLVFDAPEQGKVSLVIRDATGKTIQMLNSQFVKGINNQDINVSLLAAGKYNLTIVGKNFTETIKFTKVQ